MKDSFGTFSAPKESFIAIQNLQLGNLKEPMRVVQPLDLRRSSSHCTLASSRLIRKRGKLVCVGTGICDL